MTKPQTKTTLKTTVTDSDLIKVNPKLLITSGLNPRKTPANDQAFAELVASVKSLGILQPPTVRKKGKKYEVIYGKRRSLAAQEAGLKVIDVHLKDMDDQTAREAALAENIVRAGMDPMDQFEAFQGLMQDGLTPEEIASRFGISLLLVKRRLKLATLIDEVKTLYHSGDLDLDACYALTLADDKKQKQLIKDGYDCDWQIKRALKENTVDMSKAIFD